MQTIYKYGDWDAMLTGAAAAGNSKGKKRIFALKRGYDYMAGLTYVDRFNDKDDWIIKRIVKGLAMLDESESKGGTA